MENKIVAEVKNLNFFYGTKQVLKNVNLTIKKNCATALIGPSGCGKTTLLRCFNRMHDLYIGHNVNGEIILYPENINILSEDLDPIAVRMKIGMVFQKPNPFPKSIFENVSYGLKIQGERSISFIEDRVETSLKQADLWNDVKDRLKNSATSLSGGQQQRLCIARALATEPEILLLDEPTSALDPISTAHIEELISELKKKVSLLMVTHNLNQAKRISDETAFMYLGDLVEFNSTQKLFSTPQNTKTKNYIDGVFG